MYWYRYLLWRSLIVVKHTNLEGKFVNSLDRQDQVKPWKSEALTQHRKFVMAHKQDPDETIEIVRASLITPAPIAPYWEGRIFDDSLDIPLDYPYSSVEWDSIFETFIELLRHENYRIRQAAIARLKTALKSESLQVSNCEDYQPKPIIERMRVIFEVINSQVVITPDIFDDFCYEFRDLAKEAPYGGLILQWLNQLSQTVKRQEPSDEAIFAARVLFYRSLNSVLQFVSYEFNTAIAYIDGYLDGLGLLCAGGNYVPIYKAMVCPQLTNDLSVNIQAELVARSSIYGMRVGCECSDFQLLDDWKIDFGSSLDKWIFNRLPIETTTIQFKSYLSSSQINSIPEIMRLIDEVLGSQAEVWRFKIGFGCGYQWGMSNESYAFHSGDKLFIVTFGWID